MLLRNLKLKTGDAFEIRPASVSDASGILALSRAVIAEEIYQLTSSAEFNLTLDDEIKWIESILSKKNSIILVAEKNSEVIGILDFHSGRRVRVAHTGEFGMSVKKAYRGEGVGFALLDTLISWVKAIPEIERISLQVHSNNNAARKLYENLGFEIEGVKNRDIKFSTSEYVDSILMAKFVN